MVTRILPAVADADAARSLTALLSQLPDSEPAPPAGDSTTLLNTLAALAAESVGDLPEVVLVHERVGPLPALELIREVALRFPAVGVVLVTTDTTPGLYSAAMDAGARGVVGLPLSYDELVTRVGAAAQWAAGVRRHLATGPDTPGGPGGTVVAVTGAKGGVGTTVLAVQLALAARASGRTTALADLDLQAGDVASYLDVQFRRSVADLAGIRDLSPRVLQDAVFTHSTGLSLLLAPAEGERAEEVDDRAARQITNVLRARHEVVVVDCGTHLTGANAAAIELADIALLVTTPDVVAVRAAKRMIRLWDRLQIRKAEETRTVVNRHSRGAEIQPQLIERIVRTPVARGVVPANFKELQAAVDSGRMQDLDSRGAVRQAMWGLAGELGLVKGAEAGTGGRGRGAGQHADRGSVGLRRRRGGVGKRL
ncbi:septum formation initiator [Streptomyces carminius]|uniref:Septum formation initiator n=1 Tax=Streptomyces carminius TaxID=2665496 RepID=A0A2M8LXE6_9ACTN|nr:P-loop NTPase [Streptomyces carminius]PJE96633.1 septum formation initiator [Streptomyces carminius]